VALVRILVVDHSPQWRRSICSILEKDVNLEIVGEGADGLDAIELTDKLGPDLVLLDIQLPNMDGLDAARHIRKLSPETKILFISEYHLREALNLGDGFVYKSEIARDLLPIVKAAIRNEPFVRFRFLDDEPLNPEQ
jgi:DNA-binding NarL/FixJ family response regulator